jgi:hypothetical protein
VEVAGRYGKIANAVAWKRLSLAKLHEILRCGDQTTLIYLLADRDGGTTSARELDDGGRIRRRRRLGQYSEFADGERKRIRPIPVGIKRGCRWRAEQDDRQVVSVYRAIEHQDAGLIEEALLRPIVADDPNRCRPGCRHVGRRGDP